MPLGMNNPLPSSMKSECKKAGKILASFVDPNQSFGPDKIIPPSVLAHAKGLAVITIFKAGFLGSGRFGSGIVVARLPDGSWSAPSAIATVGGGFGGQIGFELTDFVFILNDPSAVRSFAQAGSITLGGNVSIAAGPVGRNAEAAGAASLKGVAGVFAYSKTKGLFAGVSLEGSVLIERRDANEKMYHRRVTARALLEGQVPVPPDAESLMRVLNSRVFAGVAAATGDAVYNDIPVYDDAHEDVVWQGRTGSALGEDGRTGDASSPTQARFGQKTSRSNTWQDDVYGRPPAQGINRHSTYAHANTGNANTSNARANPDETFDRMGGRSRGISELDSGYSTGEKVRPPRPAAPKPVFGAAKRASLGPNQVLAKFTFEGEQDGDLSFKKGDVITIIKRTDNDTDWWTGRVGDKEGIFPSNYVEKQ
ncbi:DUF500-domain-containing protein [Trichodelitschia bisporula]|uniref:DUF500-domain-containing protein n=1 Tax=Trichodelitschia bisporula TaxID=703511 RepID=A0A6G1HME7_9PEZI|nr:DUF500-domain-containing protein [Trichodelitschia bisporula]